MLKCTIVKWVVEAIVVAPFYPQTQRTLKVSYYGQEPLVVGHGTDIRWRGQLYEVVILEVSSPDGSLLVEDLYFYLPSEASDLRLHFDEDLKAWVLVDEEANVAYKEGIMPHDPRHTLEGYDLIL